MRLWTEGGKEDSGGRGGPREKQHGGGDKGLSKDPLQLNGEGPEEVGNTEKEGKSSSVV